VYVVCRTAENEVFLLLCFRNETAVEGAEEGGEEINKENIPLSLHQLYTTLCNNYDLRKSVLEGEFSSSILLFFFLLFCPRRNLCMVFVCRGRVF
jgi:hypothetical protein